MTVRTRLIGFILFLLGLPAWAADYYILGVQDYVRSPIIVVREYQGLAHYLGRRLGKPVRVEAVKTYDEYMKKAAAGRYDFMYAPPSMIIKANRLAGYEPVVKIPGLISAAFMALADSNIAFPEDMKGKRIGFYEKDAMVTQLALAELKSMGIDPAKYFKSITFYSDATAVLNALQYRLIDVGVAASPLFTAWTNRGYNLVMVLQGKGMPHLTFAVRKDFPQTQTVVQALLKAHEDPEAAEYFKFNGFTNFEPAKLSDYDELAKFLDIK
ncbi:phosphate/phosphite/phosphonate ABC transporter substrate-binding protein [Thiobacter aerophilum]|uniref:PhnD/SsuA/transferrin family substrate-binding protein n=1 Tax=Thiobacter aerophilum TaxID=3121275 RepID=A0ABV0ECS4_9BURK